MQGDNSQSFSILSTLQLGVQALNKIVQILTSSFPQTVGTATTATGGAATLPANPVGFVVVTLPNGSSVKVPYYT